MANAETAVRVAQTALTAAIADARAQGYRVKWQVNGDGEHSVVVDGGPEPVKAEPAAPAPATFGGGRAFAKPAPEAIEPAPPPAKND